MSKWPDDQLRPVNVASKGSSAQLEWKPPKGDVKVDKYVIYKSSNYHWKEKCEFLEQESEWDDLEKVELEASATSWNDVGPRTASRYSYYIFALDENGNYHFPSYQSGRVGK